MKVALAQVNPTVGALEGNLALLLGRAEEAKRLGAKLALFPELSLIGYPPQDLLERSAFLEAAERAEAELVRRLPADMTVVFGNVTVRPQASEGRRLFNSAVVARDGRVLDRAHKSLLPVYDVFDEARYFEPCPALEGTVFELDGRTMGVTICEDLWNDRDLWPERLYGTDPVESLVGAGAEILLNLAASPWSRVKHSIRERIFAHAARRHGVAVLGVNQVGGNDGLIFDGTSLAYSAQGEPIARGASFEEDMILVDVDSAQPVEPVEGEEVELIHQALVLGIRDYFRKCGVGRAVVALSGGIDSAVVAYLATRALGADQVVGLTMPSRYSSEGSVRDAERLARNLGMVIHQVPIEPMFAAYLEGLSEVFAGRPADITEENLQARIRGCAVMAVANKLNAVVLTTGNKSEAAVGYCTLYGDTNGGLAPIADLYKGQVYQLARFANRAGPQIPVETIEKPPSAELRPDQKDEDSLPPYDVLDEILRLLIEERRSIGDISEVTGAEESLVRDIVRKVSFNEFKRKQYPPTLRVSEKAWVGRVYPLAHRFRE